MLPRAAGFIPAVRTAGINPAARQNVRHAGASRGKPFPAARRRVVSLPRSQVYWFSENRKVTFGALGRRLCYLIRSIFCLFCLEFCLSRLISARPHCTRQTRARKGFLPSFGAIPGLGNHGACSPHLGPATLEHAARRPATASGRACPPAS